MNDDASNTACSGGCGASSKWALAASAINGIVSETDQSTHWGLKLFADGGSSNLCNVNNTVAVPVGAGNAGAVARGDRRAHERQRRCEQRQPHPDARRRDDGGAISTGLTEDNPKFILLVTDNLPNCMPGSVDQAADDSPGTIQAVADARQLGISTMVIGIATAGQPADAVLSAMAVAGGYALANSTPAYYPVTSAGELYGTLDTLIRHPDCVFSVPPPPTGSGPPDIGVRVNGKNVPLTRAKQRLGFHGRLVDVRPGLRPGLRRIPGPPRRRRRRSISTAAPRVTRTSALVFVALRLAVRADAV